MTSRRRILRGIGVAATATTTSLAGCFHETGEATQRAEMRDNQFEPRNARADAETAFAWENHDDVEHVVTSASDNWDFEATVSPGNLTSFTFEDDGLYRVVCSEHGDPDAFTGMRMLIAVGEAEIESPVE